MGGVWVSGCTISEHCEESPLSKESSTRRDLPEPLCRGCSSVEPIPVRCDRPASQQKRARGCERPAAHGSGAVRVQRSYSCEKPTQRALNLCIAHGRIPCRLRHG